MTQVAITGNTYPVKDKLKTLGAKWDSARKCWTITDAKVEEARRIVAAAPPEPPAVPGKCRKCGRQVKSPYTVCFTCSGKKTTHCVNCGSHLDDYAQRKGYKRCLDCVDGGGGAHGGASYYDRNGNFVLGDDD